MRATVAGLYVLSLITGGSLFGCFVSTGNRRGEVRAEERHDERREEHREEEHHEEEEHRDHPRQR